MSLVLMIISFIGIFSYGFVLMGGLDRFIQQGGFTDAPANCDLCEILVFCDQKKKVDMQVFIDNIKQPYQYISLPILPQNKVFRIVLALSENDMDNIFVCLQAKKAYHTCCIALCNNKLYEGIFSEFGINGVANSIGSALKMLSATEGWQPHDSNI